MWIWIRIVGDLLYWDIGIRMEDADPDPGGKKRLKLAKKVLKAQIKKKLPNFVKSKNDAVSKNKAKI